ncbi:MAG: AAA family ATPase [Opitutales bacterium]
MNSQPSLLHAEAYITVHASRTGPAYANKPTGPFVTISRETGTGVSDFANDLARRLDQALPGETPWTVFDGNLVEAMLKSRELSPFLACFLPEDKISNFQSSVGEILGFHPSLWELIQRTNEMMRQLARAGQVILVGRGANLATAGVEHGTHLRLVAPFEFRAEHKAAELGLPLEEARINLTQVDGARRKYVRSVFETDVENPQAYDLVLNMARVPGPMAVDLAANLVRSRVLALAE